MSPHDPLLPAYDFIAAPASVKLSQGAVEVGLGNDSFTGTADLLLRFSPNPRVVLCANVQDTANSVLLFAFNDSVEPSFSFNGQKVEGYRGRHKANAKTATLELDWLPQSEPVVLCDMQPQTSVAAIFHLFNFPDFRGGQYQAISAPAGRVLLVLESDEWRTSIQSLPNNGTDEAWKRIRNEGGCFLTHVAKLERKDGKLFSGNDACEQDFLLSNFFAFVKGGKCTPVCGVGLDAEGGQTWQTFISPSEAKPPCSWFNPYQSSQAEILFPLFAKRWQQSKEWKDCLIAAVYWYTQANTSDASPGIDSAIILAQAALERLAYHYLVVDRRMISGKGFDDLWASDRLRMLFSVCGIPNEITDATPRIRDANKGFKKNAKWMDAPHAITDIRNSLVHPVRKKNVNDCYVDAWKLSLWYLELSVLAVCGYNGTYTSRMTAKSVIDSESVPWGKGA